MFREEHLQVPDGWPGSRWYAKTGQTEGRQTSEVRDNSADRHGAEMADKRDYEKLSREDLIRRLMDRDSDDAGGLRLRYKGQTPPWRIVRKVQPRRQKIEPKLCVGPEDMQARNLILEGENLQAMVSLYKYRCRSTWC